MPKTDLTAAMYHIEVDSKWYPAVHLSLHTPVEY